MGLFGESSEDKRWREVVLQTSLKNDERISQLEHRFTEYLSRFEKHMDNEERLFGKLFDSIDSLKATAAASDGHVSACRDGLRRELTEMVSKRMDELEDKIEACCHRLDAVEHRQAVFGEYIDLVKRMLWLVVAAVGAAGVGVVIK